MDALLAPAVHTDQQDFPIAPSPHNSLYDISPNPSAYDFDVFPDSAHFPHTPSYNGSYQNSPYSSYSDLPPIDGNEPFGDNPSGISITEEYDPSEYDVPSSGGPLILDDHYMNGAHVSVSVTPPLNDYSSPNAFDHASPASSNGLEDDGHSHASSNSSYMHPSSPRPDISQSFHDSLSFHSPAWATGALPDDRRSPPLNKPQSPPQLLIPDTTSPSGADAPPTINAPDGDGGLLGGPTLQIVPATPVSGGEVTARNVPFQQGTSLLLSRWVSRSHNTLVIQARPPTAEHRTGRTGLTINSSVVRAVGLPISPILSPRDQGTTLRRSPTMGPNRHTSSSSSAVASNSSCFPRPRRGRGACRTRRFALLQSGTPCPPTSDRAAP